MSHSQVIIEDGAESVVVLSDDDGVKTITKRRRPSGKTQYKFEAFAYRKLGASGASVPHVLTVNDDELVMSAFTGSTLDDQTDLYADAAIFRSIAKDLALNRNIQFNGFGKAIEDKDGAFRGEYSSWSEFLSKTYDKLHSSPILTSKQRSVLASYWNNKISKINIDAALLVHGDFALSAVFVKDGKYEGIIDFGDAIVGDPLLDLAYFRFKEITKDYGASIYDLLLNSYLEFSGLNCKYVDEAVKFYMIYWAVERIHTDNLEPKLITKFIEKSEALITELSK